MDLFTQTSDQKLKPLAEQMRPKDFTTFFGQDHILQKNQSLRQLIENGNIPSMILWGPPGVGKTTLAHIIAKKTQHNFYELSAVTANLKMVKEVIEKAKDSLSFYQKKTILFVDEIHRFNKAQQDAFLPHIENGTIILIGATTENPSFEVIPALLSRCKVFTLEALSHSHLKTILQNTLNKKSKINFLQDDAQDFLVNQCHGDARYLLNILEDLFALFPNNQNISYEEVKTKIQQRSLLYDKKSEHHYNVISAFIKSVRGSDPDAALYYLARMLESGEDPLFVARRMVILASEDIGNANPQAVQVALACMESYRFIGMPEGWIPLAQCATYLACSPKSHASYAAYKKAKQAVLEFGALEVPLHLRNAPTKLMKEMEYGKDYKYAHDYDNNQVDQQHLPDKIKDFKFYHPTENGHEKKLKEWLAKKFESQ